MINIEMFCDTRQEFWTHRMETSTSAFQVYNINNSLPTGPQYYVIAIPKGKIKSPYLKN
jgi:hypothetical protein